MTKFNRRSFMSVAGMAAVETAFSPLVSARTNRSDAPATLTGNGEWTYEVVPGWGSLPSGMSFGGTHGAVAQDNAANIYVSTQSATGVHVYNRSGSLVRTIANAYPQKPWKAHMSI